MSAYACTSGPVRLLTHALVVILAVAAWTAAPTHAQDAEALLRQGIEARRRGDDEGALAHFTRANEMQPSGVARAQMGLASQALGRWVDAHTHLRAALATDDSFVARNRATLEGALATVEGHVGHLELRSTVPGGQVQINGRDAGTLPLAAPLVVTAGETIIVVRLEGYHRFRRTVQIGAGVTAREEVRLVPMEPEPASPLPAAAATSAALAPTPVPTQSTTAPPPSTTNVASSSATAVVNVTPADSATPRSGGGGAFIGLGITFSVLTVVGLSMAVGYGIAMQDNQNIYDSNACDGPDRTRVCPETLDAIGLNQAVMIGAAVGGGLSLVLAVVFYALSGGSSSSEEMACGAGPGELGIGCSARF